jgi:hypothetical protein
VDKGKQKEAHFQLKCRLVAIPTVIGKWHVEVVGETLLSPQFHTSTEYQDIGRMAADLPRLVGAER